MFLSAINGIGHCAAGAAAIVVASLGAFVENLLLLLPHIDLL